MNILVIGGNGFIGQKLIKKLVEDNDVISADLQRSSTDLQISSTEFYHKRLRKYIPLATQQQSFFEDLKRALSNTTIGCIYYLASKMSSLSQTPETSISEIQTAVSAMSYATEISAKFIFPSSGGTIYGAVSKFPILETHPTNPKCYYGLTKITIENYIKIYSELYNLDYCILRLANVFGTNLRDVGKRGFISTSLYNIKKNLPIELWGNLIKDYIYVDDVVDALLLAQNHTGVYNIGSNFGISTSNLLPIFQQITKSSSLLVSYKKQHPLDCSFILNSDLYEKIANWCPKVSLEEGITRTWEEINSLVK